MGSEDEDVVKVEVEVEEMAQGTERRGRTAQWRNNFVKRAATGVRREPPSLTFYAEALGEA